MVCPDDLLAKGFSWYVQTNTTNSGESLIDSQNFSICVNCKPEREHPYQWIEICYAKNGDILGGGFQWETKSCKDEPFDDSNEILKEICQNEIPVSGIIVPTEMLTLGLALKRVRSIPCKSVITNVTNTTEIEPYNVGYDVDLLCPKNSTLYGKEKIVLPGFDELQSSYGEILVFSAICELNNNINEDLIFVHAKGKLNDEEMKQLFSKSTDCPFQSYKGQGNRCNLNESESEYCSLRWSQTLTEKPVIDFLKCPNNTKIISEYERENNQNYFIIFGVCGAIMILLFVAISLHITKVKKIRRTATKKAKMMLNLNILNGRSNNIGQLESILYDDLEDEQTSSYRVLQSRNQKRATENIETNTFQPRDRYRVYLGF